MEITSHFYLLALIVISVVFKALGDAKKDQNGKRLHWSYDLSITALLGLTFISYYYLIHPMSILIGYALIRAGIFNFLYNNFRTDVKLGHVGTTAGFDIVLNTVAEFLSKFTKSSRIKTLIQTLTVHIFYISCVFTGLIFSLSPSINSWFIYNF